MDNSKHLKDIKDIKNMMDKATRFSSLSGISIVLAGTLAVIGGFIIYSDLEFFLQDGKLIGYSGLIEGEAGKEDLNRKIKLLVSVGAILFSISFLSFYFSGLRKSKKQQVEFWNSSMKRALRALFVPVLSGGVFSVMLINQGYVGMIAPATLIFYGLGLISASKFTYGDIEILGYVQLVLGLISSFFMGYGLLFWVTGFGICHIIFGLIFFFKYDRK